MEDSLRNPETAELEIRDRLNGLEREWVIGRVISQSGVRDARYRGDDRQCLTIAYDADRLRPSDLVDLLYSCGLQVEPAPPYRSSIPDATAHNAGFSEPVAAG